MNYFVQLWRFSNLPLGPKPNVAPGSKLMAMYYGARPVFDEARKYFFIAFTFKLRQ